jgi:hypothetical protein
MINFNYWHNEIADMPAQENGEWVDLETGHTYKDWLASTQKSSKPKVKLDQKTIEARQFAKKSGGKALTGTAKQKKWAEQIRATILNQVDQECAKVLCSSDYFKHSKFWIENRHRTADDFSRFIARALDITAQYNAATDENLKLQLQIKHKELRKPWGV